MIHLQSRQNSYAALLQNRRKFFLLLAGLLLILLLSVLIAVSLGTIQIAPIETYHIMVYKLFQLDIGNVATQVSPAHIEIIWNIRLPRILLAMIAGSGLALCGTVMQASVQNPLADPYILGISAGASLGATFAILMGSFGPTGIWGTAIGAFTGALAAAGLVMALSGIGGKSSTIKMILAGMIANALFSAFSGFIIYLANNADGIRSIAFWTMGSLAAAKWKTLAFPGLVILMSCVYFMANTRKLNAMLLGEEAATALGVDSSKIRRNNMLMTALITGLVVATCGIIGFVGLIIPHLVRGMFGSDHSRLIPTSIIIGALFLIWADVLARILLPSGELPIGIITALIGAPFFMYVLLKSSVGFGRVGG